MANLSPTIERYSSCEEFCKLKSFLIVKVKFLLSKTFIEKLKTQVFTLSADTAGMGLLTATENGWEI